MATNMGKREGGRGGFEGRGKGEEGSGKEVRGEEVGGKR
jgi:hypothetical protein